MTANLPATQKAQAIRALLLQNLSQIEQALPAHKRGQHVLRVALTAISATPLLQDCSDISVLGSVIQASQLGLELDNQLGEAYMIPRRDKSGRYQAQLMVGYKGFIKLAYQSGYVARVVPRVVHARDVFKFELGATDKLTHKPYLGADLPGPVVAAYTVLHLSTHKTPIIEVMSVAEIEAVRKRSGANGGPWATDYDAMCRKTVLRRVLKYVPRSPELQKGMALDGLAEAGEAPDWAAEWAGINDDVIDAEVVQTADAVNAATATASKRKPAPQQSRKAAAAPSDDVQI